MMPLLRGQPRSHASWRAGDNVATSRITIARPSAWGGNGASGVQKYAGFFSVTTIALTVASVSATGPMTSTFDRVRNPWLAALVTDAAPTSSILGRSEDRVGSPMPAPGGDLTSF